MSNKSYTLQSDEKATPVMIGTADLLIWGDLITKSHLRLSGFLNTMAESFVSIHDPNILFLSPSGQNAPEKRTLVHIKLEEILIFFSMGENDPLPEESETRKFEPMGVIVGSFEVECSMLKAPVASLVNTLLVSRDSYLLMYRATIRHVSKPWLGTFSADAVQLRRERLSVVIE